MKDKELIKNNIKEFKNIKLEITNLKEVVFFKDKANNFSNYDRFNTDVCLDVDFKKKYNKYCDMIKYTHYKNSSFIYLYQNFLFELEENLNNLEKILKTKTLSREFINNKNFIDSEIGYYLLDSVFNIIFEGILKNLDIITKKFNIININIFYMILFLIMLVSSIICFYIHYKIKRINSEIEYIFNTISHITMINNSSIKLKFLNYFKIRNKRILD